MRPGGGRAKGHAFERQVAKLIIKAFARFGIKKVDCYRTPLSGGHRFACKKQPGDLVISARLAKLFPFCVECKNNERWEMWHFVSGLQEDSIESKWLRQALAETTGKRHPLLVFKKNNIPAFCALRLHDLHSVPLLLPMRLLQSKAFLEFEQDPTADVPRVWRILEFERFLASYTKGLREVGRSE
jgi:hypothetical protein